MNQLRLIFNLLLICSILACGKRGDPQPPVPVVPKETTDLVVTQRGSSAVLSWGYPTLTAAGEKLGKIRRILVYRYVETLPATAAPTMGTAPSPEPERPIEVQQFSRVPVVTAPQFAKLRERIAELPGDQIPAFVVGARIIFEDQPPLRTGDDRPVRVHYAVTTGGEEESALSNIATLIPLRVSSAPRGLSARADATGIHLSWTAPETGVSGAIGYNVYRFPPQGEIIDLGNPINTAPVTERQYDDAPGFGAYRYIVTAVRAAGPPVIESEPTTTVYAEFKDLQPPPPPSGLVTLTEAMAVRVVWDAVEAADLAGYKVYRSAGKNRVLLTQEPITANSFADTTLRRGTSYVYSVSSVDKLGNESAGTAAPEIMMPVQ